MTEKEQQMLQWIDEIREEVYEAIKHLSTALRKLAALAVLTLAKPRTEEYETPEQPKIDKAALDIIKAPIADEVPLDHHERNVRAYMHDFNVSRETAEKELTVEPKRKKKVRLDDFDTQLSEKEEAMDRDEKIHYWRAQGYTLAAIAKKVGCSPQTVLNVINRRKQKEQQRLKSEAAYSDPEGGRQR